MLEDYLERLSLSRKDFAGEEWWPRLLSAQGTARLEETALLFLRANRPLPTELAPHANLPRFAELEQAEREQKLIEQLEHWLLPPAPAHLDSPRATLRVACEARPLADQSNLRGLAVQFVVFRPRSGERNRTLAEMIELATRSAHEEELFSSDDWQFIQWLAETYGEHSLNGGPQLLIGGELLQWLARWGHSLALRIPKDIAQRAGLRDGSRVDITADGDRIIISPARPIYVLADLLKGMTPELMRQAFLAQVYSVIPKPVNKNIVLHTLARALEKVYGKLTDPAKGQPPALPPEPPKEHGYPTTTQETDR